LALSACRKDFVAPHVLSYFSFSFSEMNLLFNILYRSLSNCFLYRLCEVSQRVCGHHIQNSFPMSLSKCFQSQTPKSYPNPSIIYARKSFYSYSHHKVVVPRSRLRAFSFSNPALYFNILLQICNLFSPCLVALFLDFLGSWYSY
jgi:hypothetical protein